MAAIRVHKFGVFELNLAAHELRKHGVRVRLSGQPFALLGMLVESPGQVVTREDMRLRLWSTDTIVDFEHSLNSAMKKLRAALGDSPESPRYIETIPKIGYRFVAPVEVIETEVAAKQTRRNESDGDATAVSQKTATPVWIWIVGALAFAIAILAISRTMLRSPVPPISRARVMIAVLPFENLTGDSSQDYFSDGLTEEMIEQLGRVDPQRLGVIARTSVTGYHQDATSLQKIQRELGVQYVLEGTVRRDAERVRITADLVRLKDQNRVWSREYDRPLDRLLALQGEIAQQLAHELSLTFSPAHDPRNSPGLSPETYQAYDFYLKGRYFWNKRTKQGFERARECFEQSVAKDPNYARGYAGLADTYALMSAYYLVPTHQVSKKAKDAAKRSLELDETLPEAHTSLALIAQNLDWDWETAEREYKRAIELDPNYATAHHWYAEELSLVGRFDEALTEIERARELDPLSLIISTDRGAILYYARQYDRSIQQFQTVLDMEPNYPRSRMIENAFAQKGMFREALADADAWQRLGENAWSVAIRAYLFGRSGDRKQALANLAHLKSKYSDFPAIDYLKSFPYIGVDDKENALSWLERSYQNRSISTAVAVEPLFDSVRNEPRFQAILAAMHFPVTVRTSPQPRR